MTSLDAREIMRVEKVRYLDVYLVSSKVLNCNYDLVKSLFFVHLVRSTESLASVEVVVELLKTKCMPLSLYGLDACPVSSRRLIMAVLWNRASHYIFILWFLSFFFYLFFVA